MPKKKPKLIDVLERGYFPDELPPPFGTKSFALAIKKDLKAFRAIESTYGIKVTAKLCKHVLARQNSMRRMLSISHPLHFFRLADNIIKNWKPIDTLISRSTISRTKTRADVAPKRAIVRDHELGDRPKDRARIRAVSRVILQTDVERCYPSIYTHGISWALHTKAIAKKTYGPSLFGNILDRCIRQGQDGQTLGIPIGPDTSRVIAEIILADVDMSIPKRFRRNAIRYVDDYEFGFESRRDAEEARFHLAKALAKYELALNPRKTKIIELPFEFEQTWVSELRLLQIADDSNSETQAYMLHRFFERAFAFAKEYEGESVIKYAVARLRSIPIALSNWEFAFDAIAQCMVSDPSCLGRALEFIGAYSKAKYRVPLVRLRQVLNTVIEIHAPLGHGNYVAWALWGCLLFDLKITANNVKKIRVMDDSIVALLALHAKSKGLISGRRASFTSWKAVMNKDGLTDEMWLLSYEAKKKGWLPSIGRRNHLSADNLFSFLDAKDVNFYDTNAVKNWWKTLKTKKLIVATEKEDSYI